MRFCTGLVLSCVQLCAVTGLAIRANMTSLKDITFGQLSYYDPKNQNESQTLFFPVFTVRQKVSGKASWLSEL